MGRTYVEIPFRLTGGTGPTTGRSPGCQTQPVQTEHYCGRESSRLTIRSKRTGLEKAIYQVEQALKRKKGDSVTFDADSEVDLKQLVDQSHKLANQNGDQSSRDKNSTRAQSFATKAPDPPPEVMTAPQLPKKRTTSEHVEKPDVLALDNADNPLQLLAMASTLPNQSPAAVITPSPAAATSSSMETSGPEDSDLQRFFGNLTPVLDNTADDCVPSDVHQSEEAVRSIIGL